MEAGLNLFSLRHAIKTEEDFLATALRLRDMGYTFMQFSGAPFNPDMIKRVSDASGLPVVLTHVPMDRIIDDTDALMEEHDKFGCKNIGLGMMPIETINDEAECKAKIEQLEAAGERMAKNGFKFFYHHHQFEFTKYNGETVFDYMLRTTKYINFTADTYWLQYGGVNVADFLLKLNGRIECVHLKDYMMLTTKKDDGKYEVKPVFAPVGDGTLDFKAAVSAAKQSGAKYFLVEQDNAPELENPFGLVEKSIKYIREVL